jgi:hypothetical protein
MPVSIYFCAFGTLPLVKRNISFALRASYFLLFFKEVKDEAVTDVID